MRVIALAVVKDEADIIEATIRHTIAQGPDVVVVHDNISNDATFGILNGLTAEFSQLVVRSDHEKPFYQAVKMNRWADEFAEPGDWIWPFDADELWNGGHRTVGDVLRTSDTDAVGAVLFDHKHCANTPTTGHPFDVLTYRDRADTSVSKVAYRHTPERSITDGNHKVLDADGHAIRTSDVLSVRHFPWRHRDQWVRKARNGLAAFEATDLPPGVGAHWRHYGTVLANQGEDGLTAQLAFDGLVDCDPYSLVWDPVNR